MNDEFQGIRKEASDHGIFNLYHVGLWNLNLCTTGLLSGL
jgi:hypothetical protein